MYQVNQTNEELARKYQEYLKSFDGFKKIGQQGGSFIVAYFYNPTTGEEKSAVVRDYDYEDCRNDIDELYYMPIDEEARRECAHKHGTILVGDMVEVYKGRKVKIGTVAKVTQIKPFYDRYGRWQCDYAHLDNGQRTNVNNCKLRTA